MYIIPRVTPDTLPDAAAAAAWRADGVTLVHLMLNALEGVDACLDALREAGFAVQVELTSPDAAEEAAERLWPCAERLFIPFDSFARPCALSALVERYGSFLGIAIDAEEGAVRIPLSVEPAAVPPLDAVRTLEAAGVSSVLYRDPAAEFLPLGQVADITMQTGVSFCAAGPLETLDSLISLDQMKLVGWLCPPAKVGDALRTLREGKGQ